VKARLDALVDALRAALGDGLEAVLVFGSAARGAYVDGESDVDLAIVLRDDGPAKLAAIAPALALARASARIEAVILRADEIARASDCFPLFYEDIARSAVPLVGANVFAGVAVDPEHRRVRIEQELREARIRLRRIVTDFGADPSFGRAIERKTKQVRAPLFALLELRGERVADELRPVLDAAGRAYGLDVAKLARPREDAAGAYAALVALLEAAAADVDARGASR
jgi:predicted nucleotidyltransferase